MAKKETAEQKLLKVIERQGQASESDEQKQEPRPPTVDSSQELSAKQIEQAVKDVGLPKLQLLPLVEQVMGMLKRASLSNGFSFGLRQVNNILIAGIGIAIIVLAIGFMNDAQAVRKDIAFDFDPKHSKGVRSAVEVAKPLGEYLEKFQRRNIFQPYEEKKVEPKKEEQEQKQRIAGVLKGLKLVGISWLDSAETASALIEDTVSGTTYFLMEGESIRKARVSAIYADRVAITYEDEEMELRL